MNFKPEAASVCEAALDDAAPVHLDASCCSDFLLHPVYLERGEGRSLIIRLIKIVKFFCKIYSMIFLKETVACAKNRGIFKWKNDRIAFGNVS